MNSTLVIGDSGQDGQILVSKLKNTRRTIGVNRYCVNDYKLGKSIEYRTSSDLVSILSRYSYESLYFLASDNNPADLSKEQNTLMKSALHELDLLELVLKIFRIKVKTPNSWAFFASSAVIFGNPSEMPQNEFTPLNPIEEYAKNKVQGMECFSKTLEANGQPGCIGILYPHESEYRRKQFLFPKLVNSALAKKRFRISNPSFSREWNDAIEVVECLINLRSQLYTGPICIGSGSANTIDEVAAYIFSKMDLDWD